MNRSIGAEGSTEVRNTQDRILDVAERLFGEFGLEAVSLRQIAAAAGSANHLAVQYHFADKPGLVRGILARRLPQLEVRRSKLLSRAHLQDPAYAPEALFDVIMRPIAEERDHAGRRSFAAFLLGVQRFPELRTLREESTRIAPLTSHVLELLEDAVALPRRIYVQRLACAIELYLTCIVALDDPKARADWLESDDDVLSQAGIMASAILRAPAGASGQRYATSHLSSRAANAS